MDYIKIGIGNHGSSANRVLTVDGLNRLSENTASYWFHSRLFEVNTDLYIMKDTPEAAVLSALLKRDTTTADDVNGYLDTLLLTNLSIDRVYAAIQLVKVRAYRDGQEDRSAEFRSLLGL